jgi:DNA-binding response OmpR family regulator
MLTAMGGADNAIDGLAGGADDYLPKPFRLRELTLRLSNLMKKAAAPAAAEKMPAGLALVSGEFFIGKKMIAMSESEKEALAGLIAGDTVRMKPMTAKRLRDKLLANMKNADIINVRNKGYKIIIK